MDPEPTTHDDTIRKRTLELPVPDAYSRPRQDADQLQGAVHNPLCEQVHYDKTASYAGYPVPVEGAPMVGAHGEPAGGQRWQQMGVGQQQFGPCGEPNWQASQAQSAYQSYSY